ncbi:hypothetical protein BDV09DRAFT_186969 [Aspergillus tetrazonus]
MCGSSRNESDIHPAFRGGSYFSPSSPRRESRAELLDRCASDESSSSSSSTNERERSTTDWLCSECRHALKTTQPDINDSYMEYPSDIHPVLVECILAGTSDDAAAIAVDLHQRILKYTSCHFGTYYYDRGPGAIQKVFYSPYSWAKKQEKRKQKHIKETHIKLCDMRIRIDFPWQIEKGGMIERKIFEALPKNVKVTKLQHIRARHNLRRLSWWARTHPVHHDTTNTSWERADPSGSMEPMAAKIAIWTPA